MRDGGPAERTGLASSVRFLAPRPYSVSEVESPSEVQDQIPRGKLAIIRPGAGPARRCDLLAVARRGRRVAAGAVEAPGGTGSILGSRDRDSRGDQVGLRSALSADGGVPAVAPDAHECRSRRAGPHDALPPQSAAATLASPGCQRTKASISSSTARGCRSSAQESGLPPNTAGAGSGVGRSSISAWTKPV